jgi:alpha-ketoglutarate-dependent taurine dioxygenase
MTAAAARTYDTINVEPISGAIGAEISGVDISRPLPDAVVVEIRQALLEHLVVFLHTRISVHQGARRMSDDRAGAQTRA